MSQKDEKKDNGKKIDEILVVVGLDFGTSSSGFAYCHTASANQEVCTNTEWNGHSAQFKTNTVLQYDDNFEKVTEWGKLAFAKKAERKNMDENEPKSVELFKLYLGSFGKLDDDLKPKIPVDYKKAIADYLREMGKLIKVRISKHWPDVNFYENVLLVISVPADYSNNELAIMRECSLEAELIREENSEYLQFTTEPEAAAIYCMKKCLNEHSLASTGTTFMIVDCGGGTVDLTTRKLVGEDQLSEVTERIGDYCGSSFIDEAFLKHLGSIVGNSTIDKLRDNKIKSLQYMVQHFCRKVKFRFTGKDTDFQYELDVIETIKVLKKFVNSETKKLMEDNNWLITIDFEKIKSMFDPLIDRILKMIEIQLENCRDECSIMFLVGGFGQSEYLKNRIEEKFKDQVKTIVVSKDPIAAVVRGATLYGLSLSDKMKNMKVNEQVKFVIKNRKLNYTYGIRVLKLSKKGDPPERVTSDGYIHKFHPIAKRGDVVEFDEEIRVNDLCPVNEFQESATFCIYFTKDDEAKYCDKMELLGTLKIYFTDRGPDRKVSFALSFGQMEILKATARNETNGQNYLATFEIKKER
ncbi:actin-like ATPase domain-containing protein [Rhizophagus irregularis]|uniref:Actin-like ATPase domain-containing protein n=2 Tax=Rhizophagus irregularis TaxID=588596 RepID=A0A2N0P244_9GLOM|nr:actin-like ATPase domain-containing protein [Rhizophagus irregularis]